MRCDAIARCDKKALDRAIAQHDSSRIWVQPVCRAAMAQVGPCCRCTCGVPKRQSSAEVLSFRGQIYRKSRGVTRFDRVATAPGQDDIVLIFNLEGLSRCVVIEQANLGRMKRQREGLHAAHARV